MEDKKSKCNGNSNSRFPPGMEDKKSKCKCNSRFPPGMTEREAEARATSKKEVRLWTR
jgi:hypothetical protein